MLHELPCHFLFIECYKIKYGFQTHLVQTACALPYKVFTFSKCYFMLNISHTKTTHEDNGLL